MMTYDDFRAKIIFTLTRAAKPLTWTEVRTTAGLPQMFPNNQWVHKMEQDSGLKRQRDVHGIIHWQLTNDDDSTTKVADAGRARASRKQGKVE
jgi:hypothetical protein